MQIHDELLLFIDRSRATITTISMAAASHHRVPIGADESPRKRQRIDSPPSTPTDPASDAATAALEVLQAAFTDLSVAPAQAALLSTIAEL
jgi:hypothetical protein